MNDQPEKFTVKLTDIHGLKVAYELPWSEFAPLITWLVPRTIRPGVSRKTVQAIKQRQLGELR